MGSGASTAASAPDGPQRAVFVCHSSQEGELRKRISSSSFAARNYFCSEGVESILIITEAFPKDMQARAELLAQTQVAVLAVNCEFQKSATLIETVSFLKDNCKQVVAGPLSFHSRLSGAIGAICFAFGTWDSTLFDLSSSSSTREHQSEWSSGTGLVFMSTFEAQPVLANAISEPEMNKIIAEESEILDSELQKARTELQDGEEQDSTSSSNMNSRLLLYVFAGKDGERVATKFASLDASKDGASIQLYSQELALDLATLAKARVTAFVITDACMGDATFRRLFEASIRWKKPILPVNVAKARLSGWLAMAMSGKLWYQVDLDDLEQIHAKYAEIPNCPCKVDDSCLANDFLMCLRGLLSSPSRMLEGTQNQDREAAILQLCREKAQVMSGLSADQMQNLCAKVQDLVANYHGASGVGRESLETLGVAMDLQALEKQLLLQSADCSYTPKDLLPEEPKDGLKLNTIHYQVTRLGFTKLPSMLDERGVPLSGLQLDAMFSYQWGAQATVLDVHHQGQVPNLRAWFDVFGHMQGNMNSAMATAVESVACVVVFLTQDYVKSINCRLELQYAAKCAKPMIFAFLEDPKRLAPELPSWITDVAGTTEFNVYPGLIRESGSEDSKCRVLALDFTCDEEHGGGPMTNALFSAIRQLAAVRNRGPPRIAYDGSLLLYTTTSALHHLVVSMGSGTSVSASGSSSHHENLEGAKGEEPAAAAAAAITTRLNCSRCGAAFHPEVASSLDGCRKHGAYYMGGSMLAGRWVCCQEQRKDGPGCQVAQHIAEPRVWTVDLGYGTHTWQPE